MDMNYGALWGIASNTRTVSPSCRNPILKILAHPAASLWQDNGNWQDAQIGHSSNDIS
jgi:hypothetical protein